MEVLSALSDRGLFLTIPPKWQGFGAITLHDDEDEIMITFGSFTHAHAIGTRDEVVAEVIQLLAGTFCAHSCIRRDAPIFTVIA
jgi:hypothetical protein